MDSLRLTRAQIVKAVGNDQPTVRVFERLVSGAVPVRVATSSTALTAADRVVIMSGGGTATLPRASDVVGQMLTIKRTGGPTTVATLGSDLVDASATYTISLVNESVTVVSTGAGWVIV